MLLPQGRNPPLAIETVRSRFDQGKEIPQGRVTAISFELRGSL